MNCISIQLFQRVLDEYDIPPEDIEVMEIENRRECSDIQDYMMELTGGRTVRFIGGKLNDELQFSIDFN